MKRIAAILFLFMLTVTSTVVLAQCPMCKATTKTSNYAKKINSGILYLLFFPFALLGGVGAYWYVNKDRFYSGEEEKLKFPDINPN
jgi:hypothetical protein